MRKQMIQKVGRRTAKAGFSLIEILIVVVILGIVAALVVPQFSNASYVARESVLRDELRFFRTQVLVYKAQHQDVSPGYPGGNIAATPTEAEFLTQMMQYTDLLGNASASYSSTYRFGPYIARMPINPLNGLDSVMVIGNGMPIPPADNSTGWIYKPQTQEFIANVPGTDSNGTPFTEY